MAHPRPATLIRAARSVPLMSTDQVAAHGRCGPERLNNALDTQPRRGRCDAAAAEMFRTAHPPASALQRCPPPLWRLAGPELRPAAVTAAATAAAPRTGSTRQRLRSGGSASWLSVSSVVAADSERHERLSVGAESSVLAALLGAAPRPALARLAASSDYRMRCVAASTASAPAAILRRLSSDDDYRVRDNSMRGALAALASRPALLREITWRLSRDPSAEIRVPVAGVVQSRSVLRRMLDDDETHVVASALANPLCSQDALRDYAEHSEPMHRGAVASNPACPQDVLRRLEIDPSAHVQRCVAVRGRPR